MNKVALTKHRIINGLQSVALLGVIASILACLAYVLAGELFLWLAFFLVFIVVLLNPVLSPHMVMRMYRAEKLRYQQVPELYDTIVLLAGRAGLESVPALYYLPSQSLMAFAIGNRRRSAVALTDGLLKKLNLSEIAGVLGHEVSHIKNNDMRVMWFAEITSQATRFLSLLGQAMLLLCMPLIVFGELRVNLIPVMVLIVAPFFSLFIQLTLSRVREFNADMGSAELLGSPVPLISALGKIEHGRYGLFKTLLWGVKKPKEPWFLRSHPDTRERIQRLRQMGAGDPHTRGKKTVCLKKSISI